MYYLIHKEKEHKYVDKHPAKNGSGNMVYVYDTNISKARMLRDEARQNAGLNTQEGRDKAYQNRKQARAIEDNYEKAKANLESQLTNQGYVKDRTGNNYVKKGSVSYYTDKGASAVSNILNKFKK